MGSRVHEESKALCSLQVIFQMQTWAICVEGHTPMSSICKLRGPYNFGEVFRDLTIYFKDVNECSKYLKILKFNEFDNVEIE